MLLSEYRLEFFHMGVLGGINQDEFVYLCCSICYTQMLMNVIMHCYFLNLCQNHYNCMGLKLQFCYVSHSLWSTSHSADVT